MAEGNRTHKTYSAHILAEEWITNFVVGKDEHSRWLKHSANNHFLDPTALMLAAAEMAGLGVFATAPYPQALQPQGIRTDGQSP